MKLYRNGIMYIQKRDITSIIEATEKKYCNSDLTSNIFMLTACQNGSDFKAITDKRIQEFIDGMDFVVDFDELESSTEEDVEIKRIEAARALDEAQRRLNVETKKGTRDKDLVEVHLATHRLSSIREYIDFKRGERQIDFPVEVNIIYEKSKEIALKNEHNGK